MKPLPGIISIGLIGLVAVLFILSFDFADRGNAPGVALTQGFAVGLLVLGTRRTARTWRWVYACILTMAIGIILWEVVLLVLYLKSPR